MAVGATMENVTLNPRFLQEVMEDVATLSGLVLWRVNVTWANNGHTGKVACVVVAKTATEARAIAWEGEEDSDLRTIYAEWLCTVESVEGGDFSFTTRLA